jgi:hypothetical protein
MIYHLVVELGMVWVQRARLDKGTCVLGGEGEASPNRVVNEKQRVLAVPGGITGETYEE